MIGVYLYFVILLLIIFLCLFIVDKLLKWAPIKIKITLLLMIFLILLKYFTLILLSLIEDQKYIYYVKYLAFLQYIYIPVILFVIYYIFRRNDKMKFSLSYIIIFIYLFIFSVLFVMFMPSINISLKFGYIITLRAEWIFTLIYLVCPIIVLSLSIIDIDRNYVNTKGFRLLITASAIIILENLIKLFGIYIYPYSLISELLMLFVVNYSVTLFRR